MITFRIINLIAILVLAMGFCYECRLLYLGTYLIILSEIVCWNLMLVKKWKDASKNEINIDG